MLEALHVGLCALTDSTGNSIFSWHFLKSNSVAHHNAEKSCYANQFCVAITNKQLNYFLLLHVCIMYMYYVCIHVRTCLYILVLLLCVLLLQLTTLH